MSLFLANSYGNLINTHKFCLLRISGILSDILSMVYPLVVQFVFHFQLKQLVKPSKMLPNKKWQVISKLPNIKLLLLRTILCAKQPLMLTFFFRGRFSSNQFTYGIHGFLAIRVACRYTHVIAGRATVTLTSASGAKFLVNSCCF